MIKNVSFIDKKYKIITCLKKNVSCEIYKAFDVDLNIFVVIKCKNIVGKLVFDCEGYIYKKIRHIGLPCIYDVFIVDNIEYIVMEYINGITLEKLIKSRHNLSINEAIFYSIQLCNVVEYLHSRDIPIIHGDIKPANIILRENGNITLIDFDVSQQLNQYTYRYGYSIDFCSPEQKSIFNIIDRMTINKNEFIEDSAYNSKGLICSNSLLCCEKNNLDVKLITGVYIDIYGIGSTMFYMLTGESINKIDSINRIKMDRKIRKIIIKSTKNIKIERYESVNQIKNELNNLFSKKCKSKLGLYPKMYN